MSKQDWDVLYAEIVNHRETDVPDLSSLWKTEKQAAPILRITYLIPDHSVGFAGAKALVDVARVKGVKPTTTQKWLESQLAYTLHKPAGRRFKRNRVFVNRKDEQWQADLVDVQALKKDNDGYRFLLTVIDVLSKYAWVVPLKDKTGKSLVDAFDAVFKKDGRVPERLQTDAGKEFLNKEFQRFLTSKNVHHFLTYNETKAQIVERFNRTPKNRMWRYFKFQNGRSYVEALPALVEGYNKTYHRSIGTAPERVTQADAQEIWHRFYGKDFVKRSTRVRFKFKVGDKVCISKKKGTFEKGHLPKWTEVFSIAQRLRRIPPVCRLREYDRTMLEGTFYEREVQRVQQSESNMFRIEKILTVRGKGKDEQYLVRWSGWPSKYDQWLPASSLKHL